MIGSMTECHIFQFPSYGTYRINYLQNRDCHNSLLIEHFPNHIQLAIKSSSTFALICIQIYQQELQIHCLSTSIVLYHNIM